MKGLIVFPIVLGSLFLLGGGVVLGVGIAHSKENSKIVTREHELEETFTNINIDIETAELEFVTTSGEAKVVVEERENIEHQVTVNDDTLDIRYTEGQMKWYEKMFNFNWKKEKITVYLPVTTYGDVDIECSTGAMKIKGNYTFNNLNVKASTGALFLNSDITNKIDIKMSTGAVRLEDVNAKEASIITSTGDMSLENVNVEEKLYVKASTGDCTFEKVRAKDLEAKFSTGDMTLKDVLVENHVEFKASTGRFTFSAFDCDTLNCKTDTGDIKGSIINEHIIYAHSDTGKVSVPHCATGSIWNIETDTGRINITIAA